MYAGIPGFFFPATLCFARGERIVIRAGRPPTVFREGPDGNIGVDFPPAAYVYRVSTNA